MLIALAAYGFLLTAIALGALPQLGLIALASVVLTAKAARDLIRHADQPQQLVPAIKLTIGAAWLHGLLLAAALTFSAP